MGGGLASLPPAERGVPRRRPVATSPRLGFQPEEIKREKLFAQLAIRLAIRKTTEGQVRRWAESRTLRCHLTT